MIELIVVQRDGTERQIEGEVAHSVMEAIRKNGIDEMLALCGGCVSCATCHVYVDPEHAHWLPPISLAEYDLLDPSDQSTERSRLSCKLKHDPELAEASRRDRARGLSRRRPATV